MLDNHSRTTKILQSKWNLTKTVEENVEHFSEEIIYITTEMIPTEPVSKTMQYMILLEMLKRKGGYYADVGRTAAMQSNPALKKLQDKLKDAAELDPPRFSVSSTPAVSASEVAWSVNELVSSDCDSDSSNPREYAWWIDESANTRPIFGDSSMDILDQRCSNCKGFKHAMTSCTKYGGGLFNTPEAEAYRAKLKTRFATSNRRPNSRSYGESGAP